MPLESSGRDRPLPCPPALLPSAPGAPAGAPVLAEGAVVLGSWAVVISVSAVLTIQNANNNNQSDPLPRVTEAPTRYWWIPGRKHLILWLL